MNIGMLWFDNDNKRTLAEKVNAAREYYEKKYERRATLAFVHPSMLPVQPPEIGITIKTSRQIMPNHIWIGQEA